MSDTVNLTCSSVLVDLIEAIIITLLAICYIVPAVIILKKYKDNLDIFSFWMILVYLFGFLSKIRWILMCYSQCLNLGCRCLAKANAH